MVNALRAKHPQGLQGTQNQIANKQNKITNFDKNRISSIIGGAKNPSSAASSLNKVTNAELSKEREERKNKKEPVKPLEKPKTPSPFRMPSVPKK